MEKGGDSNVVNIRIYESAGLWYVSGYDTMFESGLAALEFAEGLEMDEKKQAYIEEARAWARGYRASMEQAVALGDQWEALYSSIVTDEDMPGGVISDGTSQLSSFATLVANMGTLATAFDAGLDTVVERVA